MRYAIKVIIIGLMFWTFNTISAKAELQKIYSALPTTNLEQVPEEVEHIVVGAYWYDVKDLEALIDAFNTGEDTVKLYQSFLHKQTVVPVAEGWVRVKFLYHYDNFAIYEIVR